MFLFLLYTFGAIIKTSPFHHSNKEISPFTQIAFSNKTVYLGGTGGIVALHRENLTEKWKTFTYSNVWLLLYRDENEEIIQCYNDILNESHCIKLTSDLQLAKNSSMPLHVNITYMPTYSMSNMGSGVNNDIAIIGATSFGFFSLNLTDMIIHVLYHLKQGTDNVFKSSFVYNASYVYFFYQIFQTSGQYNSSKIEKFCLNYIADETDITLYSAFDMELSCVYEKKTFKKIEHGISFDEVILVVFREDNTSLICFYNQSDITEGFLDSRNQCKSNNETGTQTSNNCKGQDDDICNKNYSHTFEVGNGIENRNPAYAGKDVITSVDILFHNGMTVPYVGTEDGRIGQIRPYVLGDDNIKNAVFQQIDTTKIIQINTTQEHIQALSSQKVIDIKSKEN
ncbi:unnamed protein product [Mytilus coruscus]|uniref:Uncharacterized protein n=1 Tax=Mytilus coruscus TaxID=42192 RepID=A0A6J8BRG9_MYTCO|nr:unnamed protein product [Mytilus coruscus]